MKVQFDYKLFGLEPRDIAVYEAMLAEAEAVSIRSLADRVRMNRGTTFEIIKKLVRLGLVTSHYKLSRKYYTAQAPEQLQKYAEERYRGMAGELSKVKQYVTALENIQSAEAYGRFSQLYEGDDEIALLLHDVLDEVSLLPNKTYRVVSSAQVSNLLYPKFSNFTRQRIKRGITARVIGVGGQTKKPAAFSERKLLTSQQTPDCYLMIYGTKVAQISLLPSGKVQGSVVDNSGVAQLQALLFDKLWETL